MARAASLGLCALLAFCLLSAAAATTYKDCAVSCVPTGPHDTKPLPNGACVKMCKACVNATTKGCTSYFLPYFYGEQYTKHFACWETCPMPWWVWPLIALGVLLALMTIGISLWCCAKKRRENREAAMQMYQLYGMAPGAGHHQPQPQQQPQHSHQYVANAQPQASQVPRGGKAPRGSYAPVGPSGPPQMVPHPAPAAHGIRLPLPTGAPGFNMPSRSAPRHEGGGWGVRTHPAYARLELGNDPAENPYSSSRR